MDVSHLAIKQRLIAMSIHLLLSAIVFLITTIVLIYYYFPSVHFQINGGMQGLQIMLFIDLVLGPLLTFLVFNPKKPLKEKMTDLLVIGIIQLSAMVYGLYHVYQQRPFFLLLRSAGVVETVTRENFNGDSHRVNLSDFPKPTHVPLAAFDVKYQQSQQQGLINPRLFAQNIENIKQAQSILESELTDNQSKQLDLYKKQYDKDVYILQLVGSYKTIWIVIDGEFNYLHKLD